MVATHWHDDHIRGMAKLIEACGRAKFCCAAALCREEFLSATGALERRHLSVAGSGVRELHHVFTRLMEARAKPTHAIANRRIFAGGACEIWSLSPSDATFERFLRAIGDMAPGAGQAKSRIPDLSPNEIAVALWIEVDDVAILLGSDLEKRGWMDIVGSAERPTSTSSAFKIPHHGSANADVPAVWERMLDADPFAVLTPWRRGGRTLPGRPDIERILSNTRNAFASARSTSLERAPVRRDRTVERTIRESGVKLRRLAMSPGAVRLRRPIGTRARWKVETFGAACHLSDFATR